MIIHGLFSHDLGVIKHLICGRLVALFPCEDMVVMLTRAVRTFGLTGQIFAQNHVCLQRLERIDNDRKFFVFNFDQFNSIGSNVAIFRNDEGHFLSLKQNLAIGQHHLLVASQRRHPMQV